MDLIAAHLLVVDDDENNRDMLSRRLERKGYRVTLAADGTSALEVVGRSGSAGVQREGEGFQLVLLDWMMPGMSGVEVLKELRKTRPATELPVIMATAKGEREDIIEALSAGANDYVTKPLDFPVVLARIETQLGHKRAVDRIVALERDLERRNADLVAANARMKRDLKMAAKMQQSLLPPCDPGAPGVAFAWAYQPCDELGGDCLNVFRLGPGHIGLYLLDVSGHGVPAALLSVTLSRVLAAFPEAETLVHRKDGSGGWRVTPPAEVLTELNRRFPMGQANEQYFTIVYGVLDLAARQLRYASAGHPPALHLPVHGEPGFIDADGFAVGWVDKPDYQEVVVDLAPGDRFYLYSDGITEARNGAEEEFGRERLAQSVAEARRMGFHEDLQHVLDKVHGFCLPGKCKDDVSALVMEMEGSSN